MLNRRTSGIHTGGSRAARRPPAAARTPHAYDAGVHLRSRLRPANSHSVLRVCGLGEEGVQRRIALSVASTALDPRWERRRTGTIGARSCSSTSDAAPSAAQLAPCSASLIGKPEPQLLRGGCERKEAQWCVGWMPGGWWWIQATQAAAAAQEVAQPCVRRFDVSRGELQRQLGNIG